MLIVWAGLVELRHITCTYGSLDDDLQARQVIRLNFDFQACTALYHPTQPYSCGTDLERLGLNNYHESLTSLEYEVWGI